MFVCENVVENEKDKNQDHRISKKTSDFDEDVIINYRSKLH